MVLNDASQQALLKTCTKDSFYINILRNQVHGLCQNVLGGFCCYVYKVSASNKIVLRVVQFVKFRINLLTEFL